MRYLTALALITALLGGCSEPPEEPRGFADFVEEMKTRGRQQGIREETLDAAFAEVHYIQRAVSKDRSQPESRMTLERYLGQRLSWLKQQQGRRALDQHAAQLAPVAEQYGVAPHVIVAVWGMESSYGRNIGAYPLVSALSTMAFDGRRADFFRQELLAALRILDEGHITAERMTASWAGAMGQTQFMPRSFLHYAVDGDGDGHKDIWTNNTDVFASIANYLRQSGWRPHRPWGVEVTLPPNFPAALLEARDWQPVTWWQEQGIHPLAGKEPPSPELHARLVAPDGAEGRIFLVTRNYNALLAWNRSDYFACTLGLFADELAAP